MPFLPWAGERGTASGSASRSDARTLPAPASGRIPALDGLRTLAVVGVLFTHLGFRRASGGGIGVDVFFVLSGFVIARLLLAEWSRSATISRRRFYVRRFLRLMPALFVMVVVFEVLSRIYPTTVYPTYRHAGLPALLYVMDFARANFGVSGGIFGHTWSLAVEEQFYLLWPLVLLLCLRRGGPRLLLIVTTVLCIVPTLERTALVLAGSSTTLIYNRPDTRADQLLVGCLLAIVLWHWQEDTAVVQSIKRASRVLVWVGLAAIAMLVPTLQEDAITGWRSDVLYSVGFLAIALCALSVIACVALNSDHPVSRVLSWRPLAWTGFRLSYGLYLWHFPIIIVLGNLHLAHGTLPLAVVLSIGAALLSFWLVERPFNQRRHRAAPAAPASRRADAGAPDLAPSAPVSS